MGQNVKIPFLCEKCDKIFYATPNSMLRKDIGHRAYCPRCKESYFGSLGENIVAQLCNKFHINYTYGYYLGEKSTINNTHDLHVDFYLKNIKYSHYYNNGVAIEFDGYQHFHPIKWSNKETKRSIQCDLSKRQLYDCFTNMYCHNHHIKLLRIPNIIDSKSYYYILKVSCFILKDLLNTFGHTSKHELKHIKYQCNKTSIPFNQKILKHIINTAPQYKIYKK